MTTATAQDKKKVVGDIAKTICEYVDAKGRGIRVIGTCVPEMLYYSHNAGIGEALYEKGYRQVPENAFICSGKARDEELTAVRENEENIRKETAKKLIEELLGYIGSNQKFCVVDDERFELIRSDKLFDFVGNLAKNNGLEVDEI
ncbi:MAG: hypothetical protein IJ514_00995 [Clostridia bacterium]|nr:hypothetical protein [Clostridia bacterium]